VGFYTMEDEFHLIHLTTRVVIVYHGFLGEKWFIKDTTKPIILSHVCGGQRQLMPKYLSGINETPVSST
jgi:hypothetical protein